MPVGRLTFSPQHFPTPARIQAELDQRKAAPTRIGSVDELPALSAIAARLEPDMRRRFIHVIEQTQVRLQLEQLAEAIRSQRLQRVEDLLDLPLFQRQLEQEFVGVVQTGFLRGAEFANTQLGAVGLGLNFDLMNPHAVTFVTRHIPQLADDIRQKMGRKVQSILIQSFDQGIPPAATARKIRDEIGLTERDSRAVTRLEQNLQAQGASASTIATQKGKYQGALLRRRSINIARTELINVHNAGQQSLWNEARVQGLLNPQHTRREWIATLDDRLDPNLCLPLDGQQVELNKPFVVNGIEIMYPGAHPGCRCSVGLVFVNE